jgi:hypothetical protein
MGEKRVEGVSANEEEEAGLVLGGFWKPRLR